MFFGLRKPNPARFFVQPDKIPELIQFSNMSGVSIFQYIQYSLTMFMWAIRQVKDGKTIVSLDQQTGHYRVLEMPPFEAIRRKRLEQKQSQ